MRPFTSVVHSDLMEHTEPICMYNLPANVGHFVSLRHVKIFFIIRRGKEKEKGGELYIHKQFLGLFSGLSLLERSKVARKLTPKAFFNSFTCFYINTF
jgi:hypothetical protein